MEAKEVFTGKWLELAARLVEIENDRTGDNIPEDRRNGYKTTLAFDAVERIIGTRKIEELRPMLATFGFTDRAALAQFRRAYINYKITKEE